MGRQMIRAFSAGVLGTMNPGAMPQACDECCAFGAKHIPFRKGEDKGEEFPARRLARRTLTVPSLLPRVRRKRDPNESFTSTVPLRARSMSILNRAMIV